jgi:hypothetical protein
MLVRQTKLHENHTQWMTAAQLWFLIIFAFKLITNAIEQLNVTLLWIFLESVDKSV